MSERPPFPLDQPALTADIGRLLANHGAHFDGATWLLMEESVYPYEEIFFAAAVERETVRRTANTMSVGMVLVETPHGCVVRASLTFVDHLVNPTEVDTFLNPGAAELRRWLRQLAGQTHMNVLQRDCHSGEEIKWTRLGIAPDIPDTVRQILDATWEDDKPDLERWMNALGYCQEHLGPPAGHIRPPTSPPKTGRNDPCPCGSGKKFKNCHGA